MRNPIYVTMPTLAPLEEVNELMKGIWESGIMTHNGPLVQRFEKEVCEYLGVPQMVSCCNGTLALQMAIKALGKTGEIITSPFTFIATISSIMWQHCTPVFVDIDPETLDIDASKIEEKITCHTVAIMPVHVFGNNCDFEAIDAVAKAHNLPVIYDACHTFGETYKGKGIGSFGDASCFSFHATKAFNSIEGGAVTFQDKRLGDILYDLKNFGIHGPEEVSAVGANAKMNEFCAAMGLCNLRHLDIEIEKRKRVAERYRSNLEGVDGLQLNRVQSEVRSNYAYFPVVVEEKIFGASRAEVFDALAEQGIGARKYFYPLTNTFSAFHGKYNVMETPVALHVSKRVLTLPMYADLAIEDVDRISEIILSCRQ